MATSKRASAEAQLDLLVARVRARHSLSSLIAPSGAAAASSSSSSSSSSPLPPPPPSLDAATADAATDAADAAAAAAPPPPHALDDASSTLAPPIVGTSPVVRSLADAAAMAAAGGGAALPRLVPLRAPLSMEDVDAEQPVAPRSAAATRNEYSYANAETPAFRALFGTSTPAAPITARTETAMYWTQLPLSPETKKSTAAVLLCPLRTKRPPEEASFLRDFASVYESCGLGAISPLGVESYGSSSHSVAPHAGTWTAALAALVETAVRTTNIKQPLPLVIVSWPVGWFLPHARAVLAAVSSALHDHHVVIIPDDFVVSLKRRRMRLVGLATAVHTLLTGEPLFVLARPVLGSGGEPKRTTRHVAVCASPDRKWIAFSSCSAVGRTFRVDAVPVRRGDLSAAVREALSQAMKNLGGNATLAVTVTAPWWNPTPLEQKARAALFRAMEAHVHQSASVTTSVVVVELTSSHVVASTAPLPDELATSLTTDLAALSVLATTLAWPTQGTLSTIALGLLDDFPHHVCVPLHIRAARWLAVYLDGVLAPPLVT